VRAAVLSEIGGVPAPGERPDPEPGDGQVLLRVTAAPLNPVDLSTASGRFYAGEPAVPYVPGQEGVGEVLAGDSLERGTRVWFQTGAGYRGDGSLAELAVADEERTLPLPEGVEDAVASCLGVAGMAAWLALDWRAGLAEGETVLVLGASGAVGQIAVQAARLLGAGRVVAAARDEEGLARARELGAHATVALGEHDGADALAAAFREAAGGDVNVTVDPLWGEPALAAIGAAGAGARHVQLGQSASPEVSIPSAAIRGRMLSILGLTNFGAPRDVVAGAYRRMCDHAAAGELRVEHELIPLESVSEAWERQAASPGLKLVITP
jgi:NADPH:quinone reductase-like Zn-dependent oxidoreductase